MTGDVGAGDLYTLWGGAWDPHDPNRLLTAGGNGVQVHAACNASYCTLLIPYLLLLCLLLICNQPMPFTYCQLHVAWPFVHCLTICHHCSEGLHLPVPSNDGLVQTPWHILT